MYSRIHQSFVSYQLVDGPKLQYQILLDVPHVCKQPKRRCTQAACINQWTNLDKEHIINQLQKILMEHVCKEKP